MLIRSARLVSARHWSAPPVVPPSAMKCLTLATALASLSKMSCRPRVSMAAYSRTRDGSCDQLSTVRPQSASCHTGTAEPKHPWRQISCTHSNLHGCVVGQGVIIHGELG